MRVLERRKAFSKPKLQNPGSVHEGSIFSKPKEEEHEKAATEHDPAIKRNGALCWYHDDVPPVWAVDCAPGVGETREGEVTVEDVHLKWEEDEDEAESEDEEADEAGFVEVAVGGADDLGELTAVLVEAVDDEA